MTIPERIKHARLAAGLTQQQLAQVCAVTPRSVQRWEAGDRYVPHEKLRIVAQVLKLQLDDLIP